MANEAIDWDAIDEYINSDPGLYSSDVGFDMQGVGIGEVGEVGWRTDAAQLEQPSCLDLPSSQLFSYSFAGNDNDHEWLSDGMPDLPQGPSQQQLDQQASHHADSLPFCLHGGPPDRATTAPRAAHGFGLLKHVVDADEVGNQSIGYLHIPSSTQAGLVTSSPSMLSDFDSIGSEHSSSASNARTGASSTAIDVQACACISCVEIGSIFHPVTHADHQCSDFLVTYQCRYPGCQEKEHFHEITDHERSHFRVEGRYSCEEGHCPFATKRWSDFRRHTSSKHCTRPAKQFPCPVLWCKYSGSNGFARKDKLNSHFKTVHGGMTMPGKANQFIKPKANGGA